MIRGSFPTHRRYSITHRAVQRLREFVQDEHTYDDETLRDRLDAALKAAEEDGKAVRTLDAMLREPQVLIPIDDFGAKLVSIIKEDTVVTVLPYNHGKEILERGKALQERVESGAPMPPPAAADRFEHRRRWQRETPETIVVGRPPTQLRPAEPPAPVLAAATPRPEDPVAAALFDALADGRREAARLALADLFQQADPDEPLAPLWNELTAQRIPAELTVGDLLSAMKLAVGADPFDA